MAVITLKIVVGNLERVQTVFDQIKVYRSINGISGTYAELTGLGTRIALVSTMMVYEYTDIAGHADYFYKTSYYNSSSGLESSKSDAQQGEGDAALDIISVDELKTNYLFGLDLTNDAGIAYPETLYEWFIKSAVSWLEIRLDLPLRPKIIVEEKHDYIWQDYRDFIRIHLQQSPVIEVEEGRMVLPAGQEVQNFDPSWFNLRKDSGELHIIPGSGSVGTILFTAAGAWLPFMRGAERYIPDVFRVKYTAGFESGQVPQVIRDTVGKIASFGPLNIAGDLLGGAGIASQSLSIDGLSQTYNTTSSATNAGYGARLLQYRLEIKQVLPTLQRYFKGPRLAVV